MSACGFDTGLSVYDTNASTGKVAAGTTNAEEATRLLAERRRRARAQKELEEKKQEEEEIRSDRWLNQICSEYRLQDPYVQACVYMIPLSFRLKEEQLKKQQEQQQHNMVILQAKEEKGNEQNPYMLKQQDKCKKEEQENELHTQTDKQVRDEYMAVVLEFWVTAITWEFQGESLGACLSCLAFLTPLVLSQSSQREKAKVQAQENAERQRQDRELQTQHEEEERQLRKKVIPNRKCARSHSAGTDCMPAACSFWKGHMVIKYFLSF